MTNTPRAPATAALASFPPVLRNLRQWVCWRLEERDGKPTKVPLDPRTGDRAATDDASTWTAFTDALAAHHRGMGDGVGFVFSTHDPYSGIDLDGCRDPETGEIEPWAEEWIRRCDSYTEVSPSGAGVHIIVRAKLPPGRRRRGGIEVYEEGRYFTVTGDRLRNTPTTVEERTDVLTRLHAETFPPPPPSTVEAKRAASPVSLSDHELIEQARSARNGQKFSALWNGDTSGYDSPSEADLALCSELAFWTGPDAVRIDALFRQSSLYWDKWDERRGQQTYGEMTVARALEGRTEFFTPRAPAGAQDPATSPPTIGRSVGGEALEASGSELIASAEHASDLPMLPMLGQRKYLVEGWSHLLAGYPRSGKTELLFRAIREWLDEGHSVVYLTEEPRSIWEQRLRHRQDDWSNLQVVFALGTPPEVLFRRAFEGGEEIVIVDTLRNLLNLRDETDNSEVARVLNPWVAGSRRTEKTLIMAHHMRKGGGQHGEGISGGHALLGVFDIALELGRDDHHAARRTIKGYARLIETPEMVYERSEDGTFRALGPFTLTFFVLMPAALGAHEEEASRTKTHLVRQALSRGGKHLRENQLEQAISQFKKAVAVDPQSAEAHMLLGYAYRVQGRYHLLGEAKAELRQALALDPTLIWARFYLAKIYVDFERLQDAKHTARYHCPIKSRHPQVLALLGEVNRQLGDPDLSIEQNRRALELSPTLTTAHYYLGLAYLDLKREEEALGALNSAASSEGANADVYMALGSVYLEQKTLDKAIQAFKKQLRWTPCVPKVILNLQRLIVSKGGWIGHWRNYN